MRFEEKANATIPKTNDTIIYFLTKENEVVYVGKTTKGIGGIPAHADKDYDEIKIVHNSEHTIDLEVDKYIVKYRPRYNRNIIYHALYSMMMARNKLRRELESTITITQIKKIMKMFGIEPIELNGKRYLTVVDYEKIYWYVSDEIIKGTEEF